MVGKAIYWFLYSIIRVSAKIGWWRWSVEGLENLPPRQSSGMIIAINHVHWVDILAIAGMLPFAYRLSWVGKSELFENPITKWFFTTMNVIPIRRGKRDLAALDAAVDKLKEGAVLLIFPEGHRSRSGILQQGRGGAIRLAMQSGVPIVPVGITGSESGFKGTLTRKPIQVRIGAAYTVEPTEDGRVPPLLMEQLTSDLMQRIAVLIPEERRGPYALPSKTSA